MHLCPPSNIAVPLLPTIYALKCKHKQLQALMRSGHENLAALYPRDRAVFPHYAAAETVAT